MPPARKKVHCLQYLKKIADLGSIEELTSTYLYEKDVYDPDADPDLITEENAATDEEPKSEGFELPDFLKDIEDGIIKIQ